MSTGAAVALLLGAFGLLAGLLASRRLLDARRWSAAGHLVLAVTLLGIALAAWPLARHLERYERLVANRPVADLSFVRSGPERFRATLTHLPGGRIQVFELEGQEWRLDARVLGWREWTRELGPTPRFRLERLSSRHRGKGLAAGAPGSRHTLAARNADDPWQMAREGRRWQRLIDAREYPGSYAPMADGSRFRLSFSDAGLRVQAANAAAEQALDDGG